MVTVLTEQQHPCVREQVHHPSQRSRHIGIELRDDHLAHDNRVEARRYERGPRGFRVRDQVVSDARPHAASFQTDARVPQGAPDEGQGAGTTRCGDLDVEHQTTSIEGSSVIDVVRLFAM